MIYILLCHHNIYAGSAKYDNCWRTSFVNFKDLTESKLDLANPCSFQLSTSIWAHIHDNSHTSCRFYRFVLNKNADQFVLAFFLSLSNDWEVCCLVLKIIMNFQDFFIAGFCIASEKLNEKLLFWQMSEFKSTIKNFWRKYVINPFWLTR